MCTGHCNCNCITVLGQRHADKQNPPQNEWAPPHTLCARSSLRLEECECSTVQILWLTRRREANVRVRWPIQPLSQCPGRQASASQARRTPRQTPARCTAPAPPAPHTPQPLPHRSLRLCHNPRRCLGSGGLGLPHRACPSSMGPSSPGLPHRPATRCSSESSSRGAGTGAGPLPAGGAAHCGAGLAQGQQGSARGRACEHPPPSMLTALAGNNRPLHATAQEHKRAAGLRSARPHHTPRTHRTTATRPPWPTRIQVKHWPLPDCAR